MLIGRRDPNQKISPDIDLTAVDIKTKVSRIHAEIKQSTGGFFIEDKGSMNGTFVNGARLRPNQPVKLNLHDRCRFAEVEFLFTGRKLKMA